MTHMTTRLAVLLAGLIAAPALAEPVSLTPLANIRLQRETAAHDDLPESSEALMLRLRAGAEATSGRWSVRVEGQGNLAIVEDYNNGLNGLTDRPVVPDPENIALYQGYLRYASPAVSATLGRQEISLDDERFIGTAPIRQHAQTFDALRLQYTGIKGLKLDASYAWSFRTIWGIDGAGARQPAIDGDNFILNAAARTPIGTLTGFAYLLDLDEAAVQNFRLSSQTYGMRLAGTQKAGGDVTLSYMATYARQFDYGRNPNDYAADFLAAEGALEHRSWRLGAGFESLGADRGAVLGSFQTPFSSGVKFLGLAGKFLPTPPDGVRDFNATAGYTIKALGPLKAVRLQAVLRHFTADRNARVYGNEVDLLAAARWGKAALSVRYANYVADSFASDSQRLLMQIEWAL